MSTPLAVATWLILVLLIRRFQMVLYLVLLIRRSHIIA